MGSRRVIIVVLVAALAPWFMLVDSAQARTETEPEVIQFDAIEEADDGSRSTTTRIAIGVGGALIAVGLGVQQARSRLQTNDPDTLSTAPPEDG